MQQTIVFNNDSFSMQQLHLINNTVHAAGHPVPGTACVLHCAGFREGAGFNDHNDHNDWSQQCYSAGECKCALQHVPKQILLASL
jgi:hypothetical protein